MPGVNNSLLFAGAHNESTQANTISKTLTQILILRGRSDDSGGISIMGNLVGWGDRGD